MNSDQAVSRLAAGFSYRHILFALFSVALLTFGAETLRNVVMLATDWRNSHASQILIVPFVSGWLIWSGRDSIFRNIHSSPALGAITLALGASFAVIAKTKTPSLSPDARLTLMTASLIVLWLGGFLVTYGTTAFRDALFPLLFLFLAVPIPSVILNRLVSTLQAGSAEVAYRLIQFSGTPVYRKGMEFALPNIVIEVAPACSGIRSAIAIVVSALIAGHLFLRSKRSIFLLLCVTAPVLFIKNGARIAVLTVLAVHWDKRVLTSSLHEDGGILFFALGLALIYPILRLLERSEQRRFSRAA